MADNFKPMPRPVQEDLQQLWKIAEPSGFASIFERYAQTIPNEDAMVWLNVDTNPTGKLTFKQLHDDAKKLASYLTTELKLNKGDRIILCYPPGLEFVVAFFACLYSGVIAVPVYPPDPSKAGSEVPRFCDIAEAATAKFALTNTFYRRVVTVISAAFAKDPRWAYMNWHVSNTLVSSLPQARADAYQLPPIEPHQIAFLQFTSGSTSQPKGVMVTHGSLLHNCHLCMETFGFPTRLEDPKGPEEEQMDIQCQDFTRLWAEKIVEKRHAASVKATGHRCRVFSWLPVFHDMGLIGFVCSPLMFGATVYQMSPLDFLRRPHAWLEGMSKYECTACAAPNFAYGLVTRKMPAEVFDKLDLSKVCGFLCGAEPIRADTMNEFIEKFASKGVTRNKFCPAFGMAENTLVVTGRKDFNTEPTVITVDAIKMRTQGVVEEVDSALAMKEGGNAAHHGQYQTLVGCGVARPGVIVKIVHPESMKECPEGRVGEVWIYSSSTTLGYFNNHEKTQADFFASYEALDGSKSKALFLRTGDSGFLRNGELFIAGRIKDMIIVRGRNYYPQDIEAVVEHANHIRPGCIAAFAMNDGRDVETVGVAAELRTEAIEAEKGWLSGLLGGQTGPSEEAKARYESIAREVVQLISTEFGLTVSRVWLLKPKSVPKTSSGKIRRARAREMYLLETSENANAVLVDIDTTALAAAANGPVAAAAPAPSVVVSPATLAPVSVVSGRPAPVAAEVFEDANDDCDRETVVDEPQGQPASRSQPSRPINADANRVSTFPVLPHVLSSPGPASPQPAAASAAGGSLDFSSRIPDATILATPVDAFAQEIAKLVQRVAGVPAPPDVRVPLVGLGLDSMAIVELKNAIEQGTGVELPVSILWENPNVLRLAEFIKQAVADPDVLRRANNLDDADAAPLELSPEDLKRAARADAAAAHREIVVAAVPDAHVARPVAAAPVPSKLAAAAAPAGVAASKPQGPSATPQGDIEQMSRSMIFDVSSLKPCTPLKKVKNVLLTGVTGFVGRVQLGVMVKYLPKGCKIHCLVRADTDAHALERIRQVCTEAECWREEYVESIVPLAGDFEETDFGLGVDRYLELCRSIDMVYHTGANVNLMMNYTRIRKTNVLSLEGVVRMCTTHRLKPLHFVSTLGQYPPFFMCFSKEFRDYQITEDMQPDLNMMAKFYPPQQIGYPWSKWAAEQVVKAARQRGLPLTIYRLPNTCVTYNTGYTNKTDYAIALLQSALEEGMFPRSGATAPFTPVDTICEMMVQASLLERPKHWVYNLIDNTLLTNELMETMTSEFGAICRPVPVDTFLDALKRRGPSAPVYPFAPLMHHWRPYWFDLEHDRTAPFPINTRNIFEDLPHMSWPAMRDVFKSSFAYCCRHGFFKPKFGAVKLSVDRCLADAHSPAVSAHVREGLEAMVSGLNGASGQNVTFLGRAAAHRMITQSLRTQSAAVKTPVLDRPVKAPIFVVGADRLAASLVQKAIAASGEHMRAPTLAEMLAPFGVDGKKDKAAAVAWANEQLEMLRTSVHKSNVGTPADAARQEAVARLVSTLKRGDVADEDTYLLNHSLTSLLLADLFGAMPEHRAMVAAKMGDASANREMYALHRRLLQHLQQSSAPRWVLCSPEHMLRLDALFEAYPDAQVVHVQRSSMEQVAAWDAYLRTSRASTLASAASGSLAESQTAVHLLESRIQEFRARRPELAARFLDVSVERLRGQSVAVVSELIGALQLGGSGLFDGSFFTSAKMLGAMRELEPTLKELEALTMAPQGTGMQGAASRSNSWSLADALFGSCSCGERRAENHELKF